MSGFTGNIEQLTEANTYFRHVIFTAPHSQLVLMCLKPGEEIGQEMHSVDQFFRIESGTGKVIIDGQEHDVTAGYAAVVPAGCRHNVINTSTTDYLKLYTIYSPAEHPDQQIDIIKP